MAFLSAPFARLSAPTALRTTAFTSPTIVRTPRISSPRIRPARMMAGKIPTEKDPLTITESEWRTALSPQEFHVLREKGTEYPGSGEYDGFYPKEGHFVCRACGNPIYSAESKFASGCGWPAFDKCYVGSVKTKKDYTFGMKRVEIMCAKCDGHLGHVFEGERMTDTNERHCVNSVSLKYVPEKVSKPEEKVV